MPARVGVSNRPSTTLSLALAIDGTTATVSDPSVLPSDGAFPVRLENAANGTFELALATAVVANQVTLVRANEDAGRFPAQAFSAGSVFRPVVSAHFLNELLAFYRGGGLVATGRDLAVEGAGLSLEADEANDRAVLRATARPYEEPPVLPARVRSAVALHNAANYSF